MKNRICPGCKATFPSNDDLPHQRYGVASPECWEIFCEVLGKEQTYFGYPEVHRLFIDAYSIQHPPHAHIQKELEISDRLINASKQSVGIHLIALYLAFDQTKKLSDIPSVMDRILSTGIKLEEYSFDPPDDLGSMTIVGINKKIVQNLTLEEYEKLMWQWAQVTWQAWSEHHDAVKKIVEEIKRQTWKN